VFRNLWISDRGKMESLEDKLQGGFIAFVEGFGYKISSYSNKIILKNEWSDIRLSYDRLLEKYLVSISTSRILNKIVLRGDNNSEVRLSYEPKSKLHILSISTKSVIYAENNVRNLVTHYGANDL
jgi:hypothetical protein